jgi:hypothetical protein
MNLKKISKKIPNLYPDQYFREEILILLRDKVFYLIRKILKIISFNLKRNSVIFIIFEITIFEKLNT